MPGAGQDAAAEALRQLQDLTEQTALEPVEPAPPAPAPAVPAFEPPPSPPPPSVDAVPVPPAVEPTVVARQTAHGGDVSADETVYAGDVGAAAVAGVAPQSSYAGLAGHGGETLFEPPAAAPRGTSQHRVRPSGFGAFSIARFAAPVVFLVAVVAVVIIATSSGVIGGKKATGHTGSTPAATSSAKATAKATAKPKYYVVKTGDIFSVIAERHHLTAAALQAANPGVNPSTIRPGQKLLLPAK